MAITLTITNAGLDLARDNLNGAGASMQLLYIAFGTGTQGTPATATQLAAEVFRKLLTSYAAGAAHGEAIQNGLLAPTEIAGTAISEIGFFAGNANAGVNTGTLVYYGLYSHTHTAGESIQVAADGTV